MAGPVMIDSVNKTGQAELCERGFAYQGEL